MVVFRGLCGSLMLLCNGYLPYITIGAAGGVADQYCSSCGGLRRRRWGWWGSGLRTAALSVSFFVYVGMLGRDEGTCVRDSRRKCNVVSGMGCQRMLPYFLGSRNLNRNPNLPSSVLPKPACILIRLALDSASNRISNHAVVNPHPTLPFYSATGDVVITR